MSTATNPSPPPPGNRARTLAAWLPVPDGQRPPAGPGSKAWADEAAAVLAHRSAAPDQADLLQPFPAEMAPYTDALHQSPGAQRMFEDGWEPVLITDLRRVVAAQRSLELGSSDTTEPIARDALSVARLTLPLERPTAEIPATFDSERQSWRITSRNPNLRITGRFGGEVRPGALGFGFIVEVLTSFVSVVEYRGRFVLRDGYHRAYALLKSGITVAPAFARRFADGEPLFAREMLPEQVWMGDRPPLLGDYADDRLAHDIWLPSAETTLYVSAVPASMAISRDP